MRLAVMRGDAVQRHVLLDQHVLRIGRGERNDLVLEDPGKAVSRAHAELRFEKGGYVLVDLNSENGLWVDGRRMSRVPLTPNVPVTLGPYRLVLEAPAAVPDVARVPAPMPAAARAGDTMAAAAAVPAAPPKAAPVPAAPPVKRAPRSDAPARPGPIAWLSRQSKPVLAALLAGVIVFIIVMGQLLAPRPKKTTIPTGAANVGSQPVSVDPDARLTNDQIVSGQLTTARAMIANREFDAAIAALDRVFLIDPNQTEALDLRVRAEEARHQALAAPAQAKPVLAAASAESARNGAPSAAVKPANQTARGTVAADPRVARRPGETVAAWRARGRQVEQQYTEAVAAIRRKDFPSAVKAFEQIEAAAPGFNDVPTLLARARDEVVRSRRDAMAAVQHAVDEGTRLEAAADLPGALKQFEQAHQLDATAVAADVGVRRVRQKMAAAAQDALKKARQYDALGRTVDALNLYQQAVQMLPADDPQAKTAQERIAALRSAR